MLVTKMKQARIKCRECYCWSLTYGIKRRIRGYKTLIHTFIKRIEDKTNQNDNKNNNKKTKTKNLEQENPTKERRKKIHFTRFVMEGLINNQNNKKHNKNKKITITIVMMIM